ncbi:1-aminocyclopropane-1-carboxylate oxidase [Madurella mycetomatis]|uniref:1-aminocyclopropane-1-carboxylate oxidase n=1 Tax=Madurella mycetomatis TaxID=100816 RepID=A0A175VVA6_9PEZI|nr:1-aminocyclopropane-1-carboxylate oxidase [Madurella mycetomatis]
MEKAAVQGDGLFIPLIDFSKFLHGDHDQRLETAKAILTGFQTAGFIYLKNIPISPSTRARIFDISSRFFKLSSATKSSLAWSTPEANRGYSAPGREKVTLLTDAKDVDALRLSVPDIKESYEIGQDNDPAHPNHWPAETGAEAEVLQLAGFREAMMDFFDQCNALNMEVMRAIAVGMSLPHDFFDSFVDDGDNTLRLLHYPAVKKDVFQINPGQVRAGEHSDYGSITLLFQDERGGLQVKSPNGHFVDATPIEDTCVVNAADLLARWSNDTIKSTVHRVVEPPRKEGDDEGDMYPPRYSIAYFCNPNFKSFIEAIPGTYATEADKKYEGINSGEYLVQRLKATY